MILVHDEWEEPLLARLRRETGEEAEAAASPGEALRARAEVLITLQLDEAALARFPNLRLLFIMSAGVERLPFSALAARGVAVANAGGVHPAQMSEQILGVMIGFSRSLFLHRDNQRARKWEKDLPARELDGSTLLVVGAGKIGQAVAARAKAFGMRVVGLKRTPAPLPGFDEVLPISRLHEALPRADYVVLLTPLTEQTRGLFDARAFAAMKQDAVFLNYSRGGTVDEPALIAALQNGGIRGAGLDVFSSEPLPPESPLWQMPNVFITPHNGGLSPLYTERALEIFLRDYRAWRVGEPMPTGVDLSRGY